MFWIDFQNIINNFYRFREVFSKLIKNQVKNLVNSYTPMDKNVFRYGSSNQPCLRPAL